MTDTLAHRGPDDEGIWLDEQAGVALGFRRLAIVDLSPEGRQPMASSHGRFVITFNGEIYNFRDLRRELEALGQRFRGHSDTEVMLAAIEHWGLDDALRRFAGMFALAVWDRERRQLSLARDRLGIKPLYYGRVGQTLLWGSELKALCAHPDFRPEVDREALTLYLRHSYIPSPFTIYRGIQQLQPGHVLTVDLAAGGALASRPYWTAREAAEHGAAHPFQGSDHEAIEQLDALLSTVVQQHMVADVPLGAFLSGGIDSSVVVALMQAHSKQPVKTFSIGFNEAAYDEAGYARAVAQYLGTDHTEMYVSPAEAQAVIPQLAAMYDEPFGDSSQIPTFLVSQLTRSKVTVSLSGDGGDELFAGYPRYFLATTLWNKLRWLPRGLLRPLRKGMGSVDPAQYDRWLGWLAPHTGRFGMAGRVGDKLHKLAEAIDMRSPEELYRRLISHWAAPTALVVGGHEPPIPLAEREQWEALPLFMQRMMYMDLVTYLPGDILTKVDRASMAVSLEARVPLLDHRVVEFAWQVPMGLKVRDGQGKWLLRQLLYKYVPRALIDRPKMGFGVPINAWLRGPLRAWAEDLLDERRIRDAGLLDPTLIRTRWAEHLSGERDWQYLLWDVLMFQAWWEHWGGSTGVAAGAPALSSAHG